KDPTLLSAVRAYNARSLQPGKKGYLVPLHFLDRPVSGVILFAKSSKAAARLSEQFRKGTMDKLYYALVESDAAPASGVIEDYLLKDRESNVVERVKAGTAKAKKSTLEFKKIKQKNG